MLTTFKVTTMVLKLIWMVKFKNMYQAAKLIIPFNYQENNINYILVKLVTLEIWFFDCVDSDQPFEIYNN